MNATKTGTYRLSKQQIGISHTKVQLIEGSESEIDEFIVSNRKILEVEGYSLLKEEEVIYENTLKDESRNYIKSERTWRHKNI